MKKRVTNLVIINLFLCFTFGAHSCQIALIQPAIQKENRISLHNNPHHEMWFKSANKAVILQMLKTKYQIDEKVMNELAKLEIPLALSPLADAILQSKRAQVLAILKTGARADQLCMFFAEQKASMLRIINTYLQTKDLHPNIHVSVLTASQKPSLPAIPE